MHQGTTNVKKDFMPDEVINKWILIVVNKLFLLQPGIIPEIFSQAPVRKDHVLYLSFQEYYRAVDPDSMKRPIYHTNDELMWLKPIATKCVWSKITGCSP